jgi:glutathione peroxidase
LRNSSSLRGREISWNFEKFLLDKKGQVVKHYGPRVQLEDMQDEIEKILLDEIAKESESNGPKKVKQL